MRTLGTKGPTIRIPVEFLRRHLKVQRISLVRLINIPRHISLVRLTNIKRINPGKSLSPVRGYSLARPIIRTRPTSQLNKDNNNPISKSTQLR